MNLLKNMVIKLSSLGAIQPYITYKIDSTEDKEILKEVKEFLKGVSWK